jgi:two-component system cell cycle response regulator DivK
VTQVNGGDVAAGAPAPFALADTPSEGVGGHRPIVLLVDDIEDCRDVYGQFLRHTGYEVIEAADGHEALASAATFRPDVIVMDLWMPHLDGWESIRQLKASPATAGIPVLVLTGDAYAQARNDAMAAGCNAYLVKPCLPMDVAAQVGRLLVEARARVPDAPHLRFQTTRRSGGGRRTESAGAVLAGVVGDLDRRYEDLGRQLHGMQVELKGVRAVSRRARLERKLGEIEAARQALARDIDSLKVIVRSADLSMTVPARRGIRKP